MCLGRHEKFSKKNSELDVNHIDTLYEKIKSSNKLLHEEAQLNEHVKKAMDMENAIRRAKESERFELLSIIFSSVIKADPYYGKVLKEIKKGYDSLKESTVDSYKMKALEREILVLKSQNLTLTNENRTLKRENDTLKNNNIQLKKKVNKRVTLESEYKPDNLNHTESKNNETNLYQHKEPLTQVKQLSPHLLDTDGSKISMKKKIGTRDKSVAVPRLDLSKIKNKYPGEKVAVAQPKTCFGKKYSDQSISTLTENKALLNGKNFGVTKFKNWKDLNSLYVDLCNKAYSKDPTDKFKKDIY